MFDDLPLEDSGTLKAKAHTRWFIIIWSHHEPMDVLKKGAKYPVNLFQQQLTSACTRLTSDHGTRFIHGTKEVDDKNVSVYVICTWILCFNTSNQDQIPFWEDSMYSPVRVTEKRLGRYDLLRWSSTLSQCLVNFIRYIHYHIYPYMIFFDMTHERKYQISLIEKGWCRILLWISWYMYEIDISDPIGAWLKGWHAENHTANKGSLFVRQTVGSSPNKQKTWKYTKFVVPPQQNKGSRVIIGFDSLWLWTKPSVAA